MDRQKRIIRYAVGLVAALSCLAAGGVPPESAAAAGAAGAAGVAEPTAAEPAAVGPALPDPRIYGADIFHGWALDTCHTPSLATLRAWRSSRYRAVGVYYAGHGRACREQPRLTRAWAYGAQSLGWRLLPIYVGSQAPCVRGKAKRHPKIGDEPWEQGRAEGRIAVKRAKRLGLRKRSALYLDIEAYNTARTRCARTTLAFVRGWNREVRSRGYFPGFYSSADSGVRHLEKARRSGVRDLPSVMWFARWTRSPALYGEPTLRASGWFAHRRIHQYSGNVSEKHGGKRMRIDRNMVDAPVAILR
ncbi:glycoside hydrolase domain-containing protein [Streptomyces sp. XD-27]|uniref:glycoside hydrolase domain-containing protein n=1 Tax=Streptomyces sp. XD-27 TaxID=3062779 RepID=UPI0026F44BCE|nr:glycoside hydrolase domain-containing protein [Streptomyces sp. XD-27]WKX71659.1 DUF1906 domain-containing protein [Streptomyces sp. XD-27]